MMRATEQLLLPAVVLAAALAVISLPACETDGSGGALTGTDTAGADASSGGIAADTSLSAEDTGAQASDIAESPRDAAEPKPDPGPPESDAGSPTPDPGAPTPDPGPPTPDPGSPTPDPGSPTPDSGPPTPDPGSPTPDPGSPTPDPGTPTPDPGDPDPDTVEPEKTECEKKGGKCLPWDPEYNSCGPGTEPSGHMCRTRSEVCCVSSGTTGDCADYYACTENEDCVKTNAGCCPCNMGGQSTALNASCVDEWADQLNCRPDINCMAVYRCDNSVAVCQNERCVLEGGGVGPIE